MKFGINIINFGPGASPTSLGRWARFAEAVGYHKAKFTCYQILAYARLSTIIFNNKMTEVSLIG